MGRDLPGTVSEECGTLRMSCQHLPGTVSGECGTLRMTCQHLPGTVSEECGTWGVTSLGQFLRSVEHGA
jgi:hypothetical protein